VIFAYPGGSSLELHQSFARSDKVRVVLPRHEQGGGFAANGYARATGRVGVCMATSVLAPPISFPRSRRLHGFHPLVAITGQVYSKYIGKMAFQETDFFGLTLPIVKHSYLVLDIHDLPRVFKEAFHLARTAAPDRWCDRYSKDIQQAKFTPVYPCQNRIPQHLRHGYGPRQRSPAEPGHPVDRRGPTPMLYVGGGIISADAHQELLTFVDARTSPCHDAHGGGRISRESSALDEMVRHARLAYGNGRLIKAICCWC